MFGLGAAGNVQDRTSQQTRRNKNGMCEAHCFQRLLASKTGLLSGFELRVKQISPTACADMGELSGKKGVVFGVANKRSIAWAIAQACSGSSGALDQRGRSRSERRCECACGWDQKNCQKDRPGKREPQLSLRAGGILIPRPFDKDGSLLDTYPILSSWPTSFESFGCQC